MKTTPDNLDEMDCRPLGRETGIALSPELEARLAKHGVSPAKASPKASPVKPAERRAAK